jgi:hypothetical protein
MPRFSKRRSVVGLERYVPKEKKTRFKKFEMHRDLPSNFRKV